MAQKRMYSMEIVGSDAFLDMPTSARLLYYDLGMRADDDGFINSPKSIMRMTGASDDDMKLLIAKKFIIPFESGIVVIKHWNVNNYIQKDRYHETKYKDEKSLLNLDKDKIYRLVENMDTKCIQNGYTADMEKCAKIGETVEKPTCIQNVSKMDTQIRLDKIRLDKKREEENLLGDVFQTFEKCGFQITGHSVEELTALSGEYSPEWVTEAIKRAADRGKKSLGYIKGILSRWQTAGAMDDTQKPDKDKGPTEAEKQAAAERKRQADQEAEAIIEKERQEMQGRKSEGPASLSYDFLKKVPEE